MAVEPQVALPVEFVDFDGTPGSGTPFDAAHMNPNVQALRDAVNEHTHLVGDARDAPVGDGLWERSGGGMVLRDPASFVGSDDARLTDARVPLAHSASHLGGGDDLLPTLDERYAGTAAAVPKSLITTKGDLIVGTGAGAVARLGVGPNGDIPIADSTQASGLRWDTPANVLGGSITYVHAPTGTVATDQVVLDDAIADTAEGDIVMLANGGDTPYARDTPLVISKHLTLAGAGAASVGFGSGGRPTGAPWLRGSVILQTGAGKDAIQLTGTKTKVDLRDFGIVFDSSIFFSNTGHGINTLPGEVFGAGHQIGLMDSLWENLFVFGHDGNHYARHIVNAILNTYVNIRSYGGGVVRFVQDSDVIVSGNTVDINTYGVVMAGGTAHGYAFNQFAASGGQGALNLFTFVRPQADFVDQSADVAIGNPTAPTAAQYMWQAQDGSYEVTACGISDPDLEADDSIAHPINFGSATSNNVVRHGGTTNTAGAVSDYNRVITGVLTVGSFGAGPSALASDSGGNGNTAFGKSALTAKTTASNNTAFGRSALAANLTANGNTAVGSLALTAATGASNTAVGSSALQALTTGVSNVAVGDNALLTVTTASSNVAVGSSALQNTSGANNVAVGASALNAQTTATDNVAIGKQAGYTNTAANATTTASRQTIIGGQAGLASTAQANDVVAIGYRALVGAAYAIAIGSNAQATGGGSIAIGRDSSGNTVTTSVTDQIALGTAQHHLLLKKATDPGAAAIGTSQFTFWLDPTAGAAKLMVRAKNASGADVTGSVTLA